MSTRKWNLDLNSKRGQEIAEPHGYEKSISVETSSSVTNTKDADKTLQLKRKRAMDIAWAPGKGLFMTAFMMYMSGNTLNIFSIMITGMALMTPVKAIAGIQAAFQSAHDAQVDLTLAKTVYVGMHLLSLSIPLYKCANMGLLPLTSADWTWLLPLKQGIESSTSALMMMTMT